jgi:hypothetical protein
MILTARAVLSNQGQHGRENSRGVFFTLQELDIDPRLSSCAQRIASVLFFLSEFLLELPRRAYQNHFGFRPAG